MTQKEKPRIRSAIQWIVNRLHVSTPDDEVETFIRERCANAKFTKLQTDWCVKVALKQHDINRDLYMRVISGRI